MRVQVLVAGFLAMLFAPALVSTASAAPVSVGHSGWTWSDPSPQGNHLYDLQFIGNRGYAAGNFGTLLRSDDAGATWTGLSTGTTHDLARVKIIDSDSIVVAGNCVLLRSDDAGESFGRLPWTASDDRCASSIASHHFPSSEVGYLLLETGAVLRTADAGQTWTRKTAVPETVASGGPWTATDIAFTGLDTGVATIKPGRIYRTTDGGDSWTPAYTDPATFRDLNRLFFLDASTGFAVGNSSIMQATTDAGATWKHSFPQDTFNAKIDFLSVHCANTMTCLMTTTTGDRLVRTTDGGATGMSVSPSTSQLAAAAFASPTRAIAVGLLGATMVSDDAGATWSALGGNLGHDLTRVRATSASVAFAAGESGALARTTDGGVSWTNLTVSTSANVLDTSFPDPDTGYALDTAGSVLRTGNGGASWSILDTGATAKPNALLALDRDRILLIGPRGLRRSTDGGASFTRLRGRRLARAALADFDRAGSSTFVFGPVDLYVSANGGESWKRLKRPRGLSGLQAIDFVSARRGFALTSDGRLWQTRNRGRRWRELPAIGTDSAFELAFSDAGNGYAAVRDFGGVSNGYVMHTSDGGRTWQPQLIDDDGIRSNGLVALGAGPAIALSLGSDLFSAATGGQAGSTTSLSLKTKRRKLRRRARITVAGKLTPALGGEQVVVSMRGAKLRSWRRQIVTVASNGGFTTGWKLGGTSYFVAQWHGDDTRAGTGSKLLEVRVPKRSRRSRR